jgi:ribose-phosphate pyrophosphokinase
VSGAAIHSLPCSLNDAARIASRLGIPIRAIALHRFPDEELRVTVGPAAPTCIIYATLDRPNEKLLAIMFAAEALRRNGAGRLVLLAPYMCYMRQDTAFLEGEAISQKVIGSLLAGTVDRVITVDAHLHRITNIREAFPGIEADNLSALPAIAEALRAAGLDPRTIVVGPDAESRPWVNDLAERLGLACAVAQKVRFSDRSVEVGFADPELFAGHPVLLVDDIASTGGTLIACAKALATAGAEAVDVIIIHALFTTELVAEFIGAGIRSVRSTNSVPHPTNAIILDDTYVAALRCEISGTDLPEPTS